MRPLTYLFACLACVLLAQPTAFARSRPLVAIIDSGIAKTPELASSLVAEYDVAAKTNRPLFQPRYDHGTMVATILLREMKGEVDIISFRMDDPAGCPAAAAPPCQPSSQPIAEAIRKAVSLGVDAINISLTLKEDTETVDAIHDAAKKGILVVLAAGNDGLDHPRNLKVARAAYPNAVLVGALDSAGEVWEKTNRPAQRSFPYHYSWQLGVAVPTALADGKAARATGTSFAAPIETARRLKSSAASAAGQRLAQSQS